MHCIDWASQGKTKPFPPFYSQGAAQLAAAAETASIKATSCWVVACPVQLVLHLTRRTRPIRASTYNVRLMAHFRNMHFYVDGPILIQYYRGGEGIVKYKNRGDERTNEVPRFLSCYARAISLILSLSLPKEQLIIYSNCQECNIKCLSGVVVGMIAFEILGLGSSPGDGTLQFGLQFLRAIYQPI